jgi:putative selenate reductase
MARLTPIPLGVLVTRLSGELERRGSAFDLPAARFHRGVPGRDLSVSIHDRRAATPFGPAAGPHTQLAQNIALSWLAGGRVLELKTVQVRDDLVIPRPCIDMETVGFNVEWSQELTLAESLEEYVKGAMLVEVMKAEGLAPGAGDTVLDMSLGYDLAGIRSASVRSFIDGMLDARATVDRLRAGLPARLRDLPFPARISDTVTLSTFHGCPPDEIERIVEFLLRELGLHVVVKLNPTLLGRAEVEELLHERLGHPELVVPEGAFERDASWEQVSGFVERLGALARAEGRGFGVKFSNTLLVRNHRAFFPPSEKEMYLSGPPLHALAMALVRRFRARFGDRFPISFSAGVDARNFADAVSLGLKPVTVCTDLLKTGGYARASRYFEDLAARMQAVGARDLDEFALRAHGEAGRALETLGLPEERADACRAALAAGGDLRRAAGDAFEAWVSAARVANTEAHVERVLDDPRYAAGHAAPAPKKVGSKLALFDCLTCNKCIPVCPNDANFSLPIAPVELPVDRLIAKENGFLAESAGVLRLQRKHQIATFADACNECGHCDVFCPEDGGPYAVKPRFFGSVAAFAAAPALDGFALEAIADGLRVHARISGRAVTVDRGGGATVRYRGDGFDLRLDLRDPAGTAEGIATGPVELAPLRIALLLADAVVAAGATTYVGAALVAAAR